MKVQLQEILDNAASAFADRRICHFNVKIDSIDNERAKLAGSVLEQSNREALRCAIAEKLPGLAIDDAAVRVLRTEAPPVVRTVATSLTDLRREPSWLAERMTQVLNGQVLEILIEQQRWCYVRQPGDGYLGWIYKSYLSDAPPVDATHICTRGATIYAGLDPNTVASRFFAGMKVQLLREERVIINFQRIRASGEMLPEGWILDTNLLRPLDTLPRPAAGARVLMLEDAAAFTGTPYLWGGCSELGIDCSGLCQLVHRLSGYEIPRDADMQYAAGRAVEGPPFNAGDLFFFGGKSTASDKRKVTHVGIATGDGWRMIHASRAHNGVYEDDVQNVEHLRNSFAGARSFVTNLATPAGKTPSNSPP